MHDEEMMELAIAQALQAAEEAEVPVGAVLVSEDGEILSAARNQTIQQCDPTAHAEICAIRAAARHMGNYRLLGTVLYVTIEPCVMCMGALLHARVARLVYGAPDPKWGGAGSIYDFSGEARFNHRISVTGGICEAACRSLMTDFFKSRRKQAAPVSVLKS